MDNSKQEPKIKEYAGGWITERAGTDVPGFLKLAIVVIAGSCLTYYILYMYGETAHEDRGVLVRQLNAATEASAVMMYVVAAMVIAFGIIVALFALRKSHEE